MKTAYKYIETQNNSAMLAIYTNQVYKIIPTNSKIIIVITAIILFTFM